MRRQESGEFESLQKASALSAPSTIANPRPAIANPKPLPCLDNTRPNDYCVNMALAAVQRPKSGRFDSPEQEVFLNLWRTYDRLRAFEDDLFKRFDLTPQQYNALRLLRAAHEPMPTLVLADRLVSRAPDITRMLDKLETAGLVARIRPPENRRQVLVSITAAGAALLDEMADPIRDCHRHQLGHLSKTDLKQLALLLNKAREPHETPESSWR